VAGGEEISTSFSLLKPERGSKAGCRILVVFKGAGVDVSISACFVALALLLQHRGLGYRHCHDYPQLSAGLHGNFPGHAERLIASHDNTPLRQRQGLC
jgi:hypothetical protein